MSGTILGINRRTYPDATFCGVEITVVLVAGAVGDYAAYAGQGPPEWVARHGTKISFGEACVHFPWDQLDEARYRL